MRTGPSPSSTEGGHATTTPARPSDATLTNARPVDARGLGPPTPVLRQLGGARPHLPRSRGASTRRAWVRRLAVLVSVGTVLLGAPVWVGPPTASAAEFVQRIGPSDINYYCQTQGQSGAVRTSSNAYGWACTGGGSVNMNALCGQLSGLSSPIERMVNFYDADAGWECWGGTSTPLGTVTESDFSTYCQQSGYTGARLVSGDAYGWRCTAAGRSDAFTVSNVCTSRYGQPQAVDRVLNFYDPNSWTCRV